jgi:hypothetical protein
MPKVSLKEIKRRNDIYNAYIDSKRDRHGWVALGKREQRGR